LKARATGSGAALLASLLTFCTEAIFSVPGFHFGALLNALCMTSMGLLAAAWAAVNTLSAGQSPLAVATLELRRLAASHSAHRGLSIVFACFAITMLLSKISLVYVSIPLQVVVKSSKIIPVMAAGKWITGKVYSWTEYAAATLLCTGVIVFSMAGGNSSAATTMAAHSAVVFGVGMLGITLCTDACLGNWQERTMHEANLTPSCMLLLQTAFTACTSFCIAGAMGELGAGMEFLSHSEHATRILLQVVGYSAVMLGGTSCVLLLVNEHGAAAATLVTLLRKCCSMFASYLLWPKAFTFSHAVGALLVLGAPYVSHGGKGGSSKAATAAAAAKTTQPAEEQI
jgi:solute carrier family 35 (adenosine 3'-phospho 5'-phosphosulfate transporter), member B3